MTTARIFLNNRNQAVRIPKSLEFSAAVKEVDIVVQGEALLISPIGNRWANWFEEPCVTEDFMVTREQPSDQNRDLL